MKSSCSLISPVSLTMSSTLDAKRRGVGGVALATLTLVVLRLSERVVAETELHLGAGEVLDRRDFVQQFSQTFALEPVV